MKKAFNEYFSNFGYQKFGVLLLSFSKWLLDELNNQKIDKVYFLSRDGYILKKAFDIINNTKIKSYYMYASRRALTVPALCDIKEIKEVFDYISFPKRFTFSTFMKKTGINDIDINKELRSKMENDNEYDVKSFINAYKEELSYLLSTIRLNSKKEKKYLDKYLKSINFKDKVAIVDIGWY